MAISGGDGSIILTTKVDQKGLKSGLKSMTSIVTKSFAVIGAAATTATVAITKMAVSAYADYEQLVGGVETLFKDSAGKVLEYANQAFMTTGQSANEYMRNVTSFSASLLSAVGGDTEKAAEIANNAMISISDNVNKMGSSAESVQLAFQGFAKQQYMLLDNLKLGYGGTKTEMERLLKDAQAITGVKYDISNLADVYTAIGVIQEKLGIAGTTAKEASTTIIGSATMMKAAWQNVLSAIAGGGDLDETIENLVESVSIYFENIVPVVERSLEGIGRLIEKVAPMLVQTVAKALIQSIPSLINAVYEMIIGLAKGIFEGIKALFTGSSNNVTAEIKNSVDNITESTRDASGGMEDFGDATEEAGKQAKKFLAPFDDLSIVSSGIEEVAETMPEVTKGGIDVDTSILSETENQIGGFAFAIQEQFAKIAEYIKTIWDSTPIQAFVTAAQTTLNTLWIFATTMWGDIKNNAINTWDSIKGNLEISGANLVELWNSIWQDFNTTMETWGKPIIESVSDLFNSVWEDAISPIIDFIISAWTDFTGILVELWQEHGKPLLDGFSEFIDNTIKIFQKIWDDVLYPILEPFFEKITELWNEHFKPLIKKIGDFVAKLIESALKIYNDVIAPILMWILEKLKPVFEWLGEFISDVFGTVWETISNVISSIIDTLSGIVDFIVGVFTGDFDKAFGGVKDVFNGFANGIISIVEGLINGVIAIINGFIKGINGAIGLINEIPGVNITKLGTLDKIEIPRLAQGTVVPPNKEFMTILGDNTKEHEIVSPISTLKQAFMEAMVEMGGSGQTTKEEHYYLNETEVMSIIYKLAKGGERLQGNSLISGGVR